MADVKAELLKALKTMGKHYQGEASYNYDSLACLRLQAQETVCRDLIHLLEGGSIYSHGDPYGEEDDEEEDDE